VGENCCAAGGRAGAGDWQAAVEWTTSMQHELQLTRVRLYPTTLLPQSKGNLDELKTKVGSRSCLSGCVAWLQQRSRHTLRMQVDSTKAYPVPGGPAAAC